MGLDSFAVSQGERLPKRDFESTGEESWGIVGPWMLVLGCVHGIGDPCCVHHAAGSERDGKMGLASRPSGPDSLIVSTRGLCHLGGGNLLDLEPQDQ